MFITRDKSLILSIAVRKRSLSVDNEYSLIIRKIKRTLQHLKHDSDIFTYKEIRVIREELWKIKKNYKKYLSSSDLQNIQDIDCILEKLKISHPHLCSKESYMSFLTNTLSQSTKDERNNKQKIAQKGSGKIPQMLVIKPSANKASNSTMPMELDETLMSANNKKPKQEDVKEKKPLVASQQIRSAEGFDENSLSPIQKLYLQALELAECIDEQESQNKPNTSTYPYYFP